MVGVADGVHAEIARLRVGRLPECTSAGLSIAVTVRDPSLCFFQVKRGLGVPVTIAW